MTKKQKSQVSIGPEFFSKAKLDYSDWHWALIREFMQNSIDCDSKSIDVLVSTDGSKTSLAVSNDGEPMSKDVLVNKLLSLGSSGKDFQGSVGGFGKAKELLYFCWDSYDIFSGECRVVGSGAGYELTTGLKPLHGTQSVVVLDGDHTCDLTNAMRKFVHLSNVKCSFTLNGEVAEKKVKRGFFRRDLSFAKVYTNKQAENLIVVRIGGTPMFTAYSGYKGCVVVELEGNSATALTSNRDGLQYEFRHELETFLNDLVVNKRQALKQRITEYIHFGGQLVSAGVNVGFQAQAKRAKTKATITQMDIDEAGPQLEATTVGGGSYRNSEEKIHTESMGVCLDKLKYDEFDNTPEFEIASRFVIKNESGKKVDPRYRPDSPKFCKYAFHMITLWTSMLVGLHNLFGHKADFSVGFIFSEPGDEVIAQYERTPDHGVVYYISPAMFRRGGWKNRFRASLRVERKQLMAIAMHELVHGMGYLDHDEDYSSKLTDCMGVVMANRNKLSKCFTIE